MQTDKQRILNLERALDYAALLLMSYELLEPARANYQSNVHSIAQIANGQNAPAVGLSWSVAVNANGQSVRMGN